MGMKFKVDGRTYSSARSGMQAFQKKIEKQLQNEVERKFRSAASGTGARVVRRNGELIAEGTPEQIARVKNKLG